MSTRQSGWKAGILAVLALGCVSVPTVQVTGPMGEFSLANDARVGFDLAHIHARPQGMRIHGALHTRSKGEILMGHVDVEIRQASGEFFDIYHIPLRRRHGPRGYRRAKFDLALPFSIPRGSSTRFVYQRIEL